jgi:hypothetical protein
MAPVESGDKGILAVFEVADVDDLNTALNSLVRRRIGAHCFVRYTVIEDSAQRRASHAALSQWLASQN